MLDKYLNFELYLGMPVVHQYYFKPWYGTPEPRKQILSLFIIYKYCEDSKKELPSLYQKEYNFRGWGLPAFYAMEENKVYVVVQGILKDKPNERDTILISSIENFSLKDNINNCYYERINNHSEYEGLEIEIFENHIIFHVPRWSHSNEIIHQELNSKKGEEIIQLYLQMLKNDYFHEPTVNEIGDKLANIKEKINNIDLEKVFNSYFVSFGGYYQRRVGRDDHYHYKYSKSLETNDEYIRSLFDLEEVEDYYTCNGQGKEEQDKYEIKEHEIKWGIENAKREYSIDRHIAFYLLKLYKEYKIKNETYIKLQSDIKEKFNQLLVSNLFSSQIKDGYFGYGVDIDKLNNFIHDVWEEKNNNLEFPKN